MWTRKELKERAKTALKRNYWKTVLVAMLAMAIGGAGMSSAAGAVSQRGSQHGEASYHEVYSQEQVDQMVVELEDAHQQIFVEGADPREVLEGLEPSVSEALGEAVGEEDIAFVHPGDSMIPEGMVGLFLGMVGLVVLVLFATALAVDALVLNPLAVGSSRFFAHNLNQASEVKEVAWGFDRNYRETAKTMFWRDIYIVLWGLLLVVPGIVKAYEYCMIPYLLADDPTLTKDEAFARSKELMNGNKWRAFVLDLSFLGWDLLSLLTVGILAILYVDPYKCMTKAALYEELRYGNSAPRDDHALAPSAADELAAQVPVPPFAS